MKITYLLICTMILLGIIANTFADEIYYWTDENGVLHCSTDPPPESFKNEAKSMEYTKEPVKQRKKIVTEQDTSDAEGDLEKKAEKSIKNEDIIIYTKRVDIKCNKAKEWLYNGGVKYQEYQIDEDEEAMNRFVALGGVELPMIVIGEKQYHGMPGVMQVLDILGIRGKSY